MRVSLAIGLAFGLLASAAPVSAATVLFSGTRQNIDSPGAASARCGSRTTISVRNDPPTATSSGTSNLGSFTPTLSHCIQLPPSMSGQTIFDLGEFEFALLSGDLLTGTYSGTLTPLSPGVFSIFQTHLVTGGTGIFAGATGAFDSMGTLSFLTGRPTAFQTFEGTLNLPVPEPGTWVMMLGGFALMGAALRSGRRREKALQAMV